MSYTTPHANRGGMMLTAAAVLTLALAACSSAASSSLSSSSSPSPSQAPPASQVAVLRCASTPDAAPSATIQWNLKVEGGDPTIKAGQAVAFITQASKGLR